MLLSQLIIVYLTAYLTTYRTKVEFQLVLKTSNSQIFLVLGKLGSG